MRSLRGEVLPDFNVIECCGINVRGHFATCTLCSNAVDTGFPSLSEQDFSPISSERTSLRGLHCGAMTLPMRLHLCATRTSLAYVAFCRPLFTYVKNDRFATLYISFGDGKLVENFLATLFFKLNKSFFISLLEMNSRESERKG